MNYGPLILLAAFFALSSSWFTFVMKPTMQLGLMGSTNVLGGNLSYPTPRPGLARRGAEVYRANGCASCHSQQVRQSATLFEVLLTEPGTNQAALVEALGKALPNKSAQQREEILSRLPQTIVTEKDRRVAEALVKTLSVDEAKAALWVVPTGLDIARGWGKRRTVAEDYLHESTVMLGSLRVGPDLANAGVRLPDPAWHLRHLYAPRSEVEGSIMPPYRFLFETRKIRGAPSPNALSLQKGFAPPAGSEVVPTEEAIALVAYLTSLRADAPLFSAPLSISAPAAQPTAGTNNAAATTNSPAQSTDAKTNDATATTNSPPQ